MKKANIENVWEKFMHGQVSVSEAEKVSGAYKGLDKIAEVSHKLSLAGKVAWLVPFAVVEG